MPFLDQDRPRGMHSETRFRCGLDPEEDPVAIIGFAFEFPQDATSSERFWRMICEGRSATTDVPRDRMNVDAFYHPDTSRHGSVCMIPGLWYNIMVTGSLRSTFEGGTLSLPTWVPSMHPSFPLRQPKQPAWIRSIDTCLKQRIMR
jgi:hypothetical protein